MNIIEIVPKDNAILQIRTEDGQTGVFDVTPYLESEVFAPLKDNLEFKRVRNGKYFIEWDCGADLSADTIFAKWTSNSSNGATTSVFSGAPDYPTARSGQSSEYNKSSFSGEKPTM